MTKSIINTNHISAFVMGAVMCFAFASNASAMETDAAGVTDARPEKNYELKKQLDAAQKLVKSLRASLKEVQSVNKAIVADLKTERKSDRKENRQINKAAFLESIANLPPAEKKVKLMEYVATLKAEAQAKRAEAQALRAEKKEDRVSDRVDFKASLEGMTREEKLAALAERLQELLKKRQERTDTLTDKLDKYADDEEESDDSEEEEDDEFDEEESDDQNDDDEEV